MDKDFFKNYYQTFKSNIIKITGETKQNKIADVLGVSEATISRWFSGTAIPTLADLLEISKKFDCSIDWLLGNDSKSASDYSVYDICKLLTNIDSATNFSVRDIEVGCDNAKKILTTICFTDPIIEEIFGLSDVERELNTFLRKYGKLKQAKSQELLDNDIFRNAVNAQLNKLSRKKINSDFSCLPDPIDEELPFNSDEEPPF